MLAPLNLPRRPGVAPAVHGPVPHTQLEQVAPTELQEELWGRMRVLHGVYNTATCVPYPEARAVCLPPEFAGGPPEAFIREGPEFAHLHHQRDSSLHLTLPETYKDEVEAAGWGLRHPTQNTVLVYGPRDRRELEVVFRLVLASYEYARGSTLEDGKT